MKYFIVILVSLSFLISAEEIGTYQLETTTYTNKKGTVYIVETVLNTKTGEVVKRRRVKASSYKLPYKARNGKVITKE